MACLVSATRACSRAYKLEGLKSNSWYEVKISYPASIPVQFSLKLLKNGEMELKLNHMRRLLNTEKLIFKAETHQEGALYVLVTAEPEGIMAIPNSEERSFIIYNIGKLTLSVHFFCLVVAFLAPWFLPSSLLIKNQATRSLHRSHRKDPYV
ncbi:hypothetical protein EUTSA_v10019630mg [Eutrema salsugineum]|uniref:Uncharacterized protein n=1 Tax=Eutrema salsugineum TaxID=72664 RepID=V4JQI7_EUTSA|nr:hypothetical protein EUTSA_v10019630mg [Eutrema salsugineum]